MIFLTSVWGLFLPHFSLIMWMCDSFGWTCTNKSMLTKSWLSWAQHQLWVKFSSIQKVWRTCYQTNNQTSHTSWLLFKNPTSEEESLSFLNVCRTCCPPPSFTSFYFHIKNKTCACIRRKPPPGSDLYEWCRPRPCDCLTAATVCQYKYSSLQFLSAAELSVRRQRPKKAVWYIKMTKRYK